MPWFEIDDAAALKLHDKEATGTHYVVFFASGEPPWCPDCRDAEPHLKAFFGPASAPKLNVVRVGERDEWKTPSNKWRTKPYEVESIPTLVKLIDGKEVTRLGEDECKSDKELRKALKGDDKGFCVVA